jgi:hypothetical protein
MATRWIGGSVPMKHRGRSNDDHEFGARTAEYGRGRTRPTITPTNITALARRRRLQLGSQRDLLDGG